MSSVPVVMKTVAPEGMNSTSCYGGVWRRRCGLWRRNMKGLSGLCLLSERLRSVKLKTWPPFDNCFGICQYLQNDAIKLYLNTFVFFFLTFGVVGCLQRVSNKERTRCDLSKTGRSQGLASDSLSAATTLALSIKLTCPAKTRFTSQSLPSERHSRSHFPTSRQTERLFLFYDYLTLWH